MHNVRGSCHNVVWPFRLLYTYLFFVKSRARTARLSCAAGTSCRRAAVAELKSTQCCEILHFVQNDSVVPPSLNQGAPDG